VQDVTCDLCGADAPVEYARRPPRADVLHARFVRCRCCGAIYADPRASPDEARAYYAAVAERGAVSRDRPPDARRWRARVAERRGHLELAREFVSPGAGARFLDVGFGDGAALAAAAELGYEPHGLEYSSWLVDSARSRLGLETVQAGGLEDCAHPDEWFAIAYAWHVVEHVLDVHAWMRELSRIVRPGGVLVIGTESAQSLFGTLWRLPFRLARRMPWPPTSTDHTHWFSADGLAALLERHGFEPVHVRVYEESPAAILRSLTLRGLANPRWLVALSLYLATAVVSTLMPRLGGKLLVIAVRRE
jgi:SAM-dependent methyltransferase